MEQSYLRHIYWQLTGVIMAVMLAALAAISWLSHDAFERELVPEMALKAATVGASVRALVNKAMDYGIEFRDIYGTEQALKDSDDDNPDISYLALTDASGKIMADSGRRPTGARAHFESAQVLKGLAQPAGDVKAVLVGGSYVVSVRVDKDATGVGMLHIGIAEEFVRNVMLEALLDLLVVLVVALFFTLELLNFLAGAPLAAGLRDFATNITRVKGGDFAGRIDAKSRDEIGRILAHVDAVIVRLNQAYAALEAELKSTGSRASAAAVSAWQDLQKRYRFGSGAAVPVEDVGAMARIRAPLFTFILAEELSRSFLPAYVNQLIVPVPGISAQVVIGLPIVLFMLIVAIGQPFLGAWSERVGRRKAMLVGACIGTAGFVATALAHNLLDLLVWRSLCAVGYAIVFVAAQGYILDHARPQERAQGFALFIGAIMVATICGPPIGGILADNIGNRMTFGISAVLCALSILAIRMLPVADGLSLRRPERPPTMADFGRLLLNVRFMVLTGLAAMPAKIILTGFCFYLVPLYIVSIGSTQAMAGRMLMVYAVMMVLIVPFAAKFTDRGARRETLVALGLLISGAGGMLLLTSGNFLIVFAVVLCLGLGQALSIASQSALVAELCKEEIERYGDGSVYGVYRMLERLGNALGPLIAGILVVRQGYEGAFVAISGLVLVCGILFALSIALIRRTPPPAVVPA
jgi:MFS family permease/HAMP domain-containing protein